MTNAYSNCIIFIRKAKKTFGEPALNIFYSHYVTFLIYDCQ